MATHLRLALHVELTGGSQHALHVARVPLGAGAAVVRVLTAVLRERLPAVVLHAHAVLAHARLAVRGDFAARSVLLPRHTHVARRAGGAVLRGHAVDGRVHHGTGVVLAPPVPARSGEALHFVFAGLVDSPLADAHVAIGTRSAVLHLVASP